MFAFIIDSRIKDHNHQEVVFRVWTGLCQWYAWLFEYLLYEPQFPPNPRQLESQLQHAYVQLDGYAEFSFIFVETRCL